MEKQSQCSTCSTGKCNRSVLDGTTLSGRYTKDELIAKIVERGVQLADAHAMLAVVPDSQETIGLYVKHALGNDGPDKCHMEWVCCDANGQGQWVMVCDH